MKIAIINRAVVGSGKSTMAKAIAFKTNTAVHSTDEFFMDDGEYKFDPSKLGVYHAANLSRFNDSCKQGIPVVICDNTNIDPMHCVAYVDAAKENDYKVIQMFFMKDTLDNHMKRNAHSVPEAGIIRMMDALKQETIGEDMVMNIEPDTFIGMLNTIPNIIETLVKES